MSDNKHPNYTVLNLIAYGLAKFNMDLVKAFKCKTYSQFYKYVVSLKIADTVDTVKTRRDIFDPFFDNGRKGWWQKGDAYIHRKHYIDSLYGDLDVSEFALIVGMHIGADVPEKTAASPIIKSRFKQLQITGKEAEFFFMKNYTKIDEFANGKLDDARFLGDGYDFQIADSGQFYLAEVKGVKLPKGGIRLTEREYEAACEHRDNYGLIVVSNLVEEVPKMTAIFDPVSEINLTKKSVMATQVTYHSEALVW